MPINLAIALVYFLIRAITTYDSRLIQAESGQMSSLVASKSEGYKLPSWVGYFVVLEWVVAIVLLILNWEFFIALYIAIFVLRVLPVMEMIGYLVMRPFLRVDENYY